MSTTDARAKDQAKAQLESIVEMVKRLEHVGKCNGGEDCELTDKEILEGLNLCYQEGDKASAEDREDYHDEEKAREAFQDDPLSVEVRSGWHEPGGDSSATEYTILLCTGGPAVRIIGELGEHQEPETAKIEYQDWFTPWEAYHETSSEEDEALLTYARQFYFSEC
ncbi:unnamed protein product [marine sediment metagenome]|uniref:Uncharacterized protein n=1 Tax=marine sediment metagenome TaxID=412755 RepID=X1F2Q4_9ZZZZ